MVSELPCTTVPAPFVALPGFALEMRSRAPLWRALHEGVGRGSAPACPALRNVCGYAEWTTH